MPLTSEAAFLACIDRHFPNTHRHMLLGRGDDGAVLACPGTLCMSSDLFLEDVHFRRGYFLPEEIGYKALAVNLSDMAASGAVPLGFNLGLMVPAASAGGEHGGEAGDTCSDVYWNAFFSGMAELAAVHDVALTGGDLSRSPMLGAAVTIWGAQASLGEGAAPFLQRGGAAHGDVIFLVGDFGLARIGLLALESMGRDAVLLYPAATAAHLRPVPRVPEGQALARFSADGQALARFSAEGRVSIQDSPEGDAVMTAGSGETGGTARAGGHEGTGAGCISLMDLSDGLARDIPRLLATDRGSGLCAELAIDRNGLHPEVEAYCLANDLDPLEQAVLGGEDYALLGTCPAARAKELQALLPQVRIIGTVAAGEVHSLNGLPWQPCGFDHFTA